MARSDWLKDDVMHLILGALTEQNRLAVITSLVTGLRIGDVLSLKSRDLIHETFTITEQKTLKRRRVRLPVALKQELMSIAGRVYVFEHRLDPLKTRSRQAVYKDIKRAAALFRIRANVSPHSARKIYAVAEYKKDMDIRRVKRLLNHSNEAVTMIYALADELTARKAKK